MLTCMKCGLAGVNCVCKDICTEEATCTCPACQESWRADCCECGKSVHPSDLNGEGVCSDCVIEYFEGLNPPMTPVEIQGTVDKHWRRFRDAANKDVFIRAAVKELDQQLKEKAEEKRLATLDMAEEMTLGGIHPNTRRFMD